MWSLTSQRPAFASLILGLKASVTMPNLLPKFIRRFNSFLLSSSTISLDKLLDAGLYTGEVTEIAGGPGSGKTQVLLGPAAGRVGGGGYIVVDSLGSSCGCPCELQGQNRPDRY